MNKLASLSSELEEGCKISGAFYRSLSSGDSISGEYKGGKIINFNPFCTPVIGCNDFPYVKDSRGALMQRVEVLEYSNSFRKVKKRPEEFYTQLENLPKKDPEILNKLLEEKSGIFNYALKGIVRVIRRKGKFTVPRSSSILKESWSLENDQVKRFVNEFYTIDLSGNSTVEIGEVYDKYKHWADTVGIQSQITNISVFSRRIRSIFKLPRPSNRDRSSSARKIRGISLKKVDYLDEDPV